ncbi:MAG: SDR family oxidoreductase [Clostridia bacterium]|nr:SDR family oxidoreductase [Clostridia bacterium]
MKALITGASSGIGRDIARSLARRGYDLILVARREERLCELKAQLPVNVQVIPLDLAVKGNCRALYEKVRDQEIDVLVNNAGKGIFGAFDETDLGRELEMLSVNIRATHILTKLFLPDFKARNRGHILNVASSAAFLPGPLLSSYYASKAYVMRLSEAIAEELRRAGSDVKISILCPGPVQTEFDRLADVTFSNPSLDSRSVAEYAVRQMFRGRLLIIPGRQMKFLHTAARLVPDAVLSRIVWHVQKRKEHR